MPVRRAPNSHHMRTRVTNNVCCCIFKPQGLERREFSRARQTHKTKTHMIHDLRINDSFPLGCKCTCRCRRGTPNSTTTSKCNMYYILNNNDIVPNRALAERSKPPFPRNQRRSKTTNQSTPNANCNALSQPKTPHTHRRIKQAYVSRKRARMQAVL